LRKNDSRRGTDCERLGAPPRALGFLAALGIADLMSPICSVGMYKRSCIDPDVSPCAVSIWTPRTDTNRKELRLAGKSGRSLSSSKTCSRLCGGPPLTFVRGGEGQRRRDPSSQRRCIERELMRSVESRRKRDDHEKDPSRRSRFYEGISRHAESKPAPQTVLLKCLCDKISGATYQPSVL